MAVGAVLGVAGAALQGIHRTQIVDAHLLGISAASGIGVAVGHALGGYVSAPSNTRLITAVLLGALGGALYSLASGRLGSAGGGSIILILMGIAAGLAMTASTGLFVLAVDSPAVPTLSFFIFGSLAGAQWATLGAAVPLLVAALAVLWWLAPGLDLMALGEDVSVHLGFDLTAVIGPSGAGKTTLLRVMAGDVAPTHGSVLYDGEPSPARQCRRARQTPLGAVAGAHDGHLLRPRRGVLTSELLSTVYRHPIDVVEHPTGDGLLVLPRSGPASPDDHGLKAESCQLIEAISASSCSYPGKEGSANTIASDNSRAVAFSPRAAAARAAT